MNVTTKEPTQIGPDGRPLLEQPAWRRDFPIDVPEDQYVARRDFTKFLGLTSLAFVVGQFWIVAQNWLRSRRGEPPKAPVGSLDDIKRRLPVGGALVFHYPDESDPCLLIRTEENAFVAYDQKCTHLSCAVVPGPAGQLHCPCHHGYFDQETGRPLAGPPRRPLPRIRLERSGGVLYATGVDRSTI